MINNRDAINSEAVDRLRRLERRIADLEKKADKCAPEPAETGEPT